MSAVRTARPGTITAQVLDLYRKRPDLTSREAADELGLEPERVRVVEQRKDIRFRRVRDGRGGQTPPPRDEEMARICQEAQRGAFEQAAQLAERHGRDLALAIRRLIPHPQR